MIRADSQGKNYKSNHWLRESGVVSNAKPRCFVSCIRSVGLRYFDGTILNLVLYIARAGRTVGWIRGIILSSSRREMPLETEKTQDVDFELRILSLRNIEARPPWFITAIESVTFVERQLRCYSVQIV
jgi:hypothetical protein